MRKAYENLVENLKESPLGKATRRWEDNFRMDLRGIGWIQLAQGRGQWPVKAVMKLRVP
jgi:hypothetical protein